MAVSQPVCFPSCEIGSSEDLYNVRVVKESAIIQLRVKRTVGRLCVARSHCQLVPMRENDRRNIWTTAVLKECQTFGQEESVTLLPFCVTIS